jgi:hypothetical protein
MRVFNVMTAAQATKAGVDDPRSHFRVDFGKVNMVANGKGIFGQGDEIGVVEPWRWPSADSLPERETHAPAAVVADVPDDLLADLKVRLENGDYKASKQADNGLESCWRSCSGWTRRLTAIESSRCSPHGSI